MPVPWSCVEVEDWLQAGRFADEPLGGKEKFWFIGPDRHRYLFKYARCDDDGTNTRGEDWAEWAVAALAGLIGVPTAVTFPARSDGRRGWP